MATDHYDALETRDPAEREREQLGRLSEIVAHAMSAPGWARRLRGCDPTTLTTRADLARLPILRKSELPALQAADPPFGGLNVAPPGRARRLMMSPGPIFEPDFGGVDSYGAARALFACGFRPGDVVHNSFSYHLTPGGFIFESGLQALGCAVVPGGVGNTEQQVDAIGHLRPSAYVGTPDFLKVLIDAAAMSGKDVSSLARGLVSGAALPDSLRRELRARAIDVSQCYAVAEVGIIAYETEARDGLVTNEHLIVEIVRPGTGEPVPSGEVGEVVVTSFNPHYPMIRLATGDLSALLAGPSPCGRSNLRITGWMGRADQTTKVKGMFVRPEQIAEIGRRHPQLGRLRLVVTRTGEQDAVTLVAECATATDDLSHGVAASLLAVTKIRGAVRVVAVGDLPKDGKIIADERGSG